MSIDVILWGPGEVRGTALRDALARPEINIVGCKVYSEAKDGVDVGVLAGGEPIGVFATRDADALVALEADCVIHTPMLPFDISDTDDETIRLLESGKNVISAVDLRHGSPDHRVSDGPVPVLRRPTNLDLRCPSMVVHHRRRVRPGGRPCSLLSPPPAQGLGSPACRSDHSDGLRRHERRVRMARVHCSQQQLRRFPQRERLRALLVGRRTGHAWCAFCLREQKDAAEVLDWASRQSWSNGVSGMMGPSYMGINQLFAAAQQPRGLKAIFPAVPLGDAYRDVVASGGAIDLSFMGVWLGLTTAYGQVLPPTTMTDAPAGGLATIVQHLAGIATFTVPFLSDGLIGGAQAYDSAFYRERSPLTVVGRIKVPTFIVTGESDIFQRGAPMVFDRLQAAGIPVRMIDGPWTHTEAIAGAGLEQSGLPSIPVLELHWFDHYLKGVVDRRLASLAPITYYQQGADRWSTARRWLDPATTRATVLPLGGHAGPGGAGTLGSTPSSPSTSLVYPIPLQGACSNSTRQWTAVLPDVPILGGACFGSNAINDATSTIYDTAPLTKSLRIFGPINAHLNVSSLTGDGILSVALVDVAPDGSQKRLTGGWQVISLRALDSKDSRYLEGKLIQPYHPFTAASRAAAKPDQSVPVDVEIFPTGAEIQPGHFLRLAIQVFDVPHLVPTLTELPGVATVLTVHSTLQAPSTLTMPTLE